MKYFNFIKYSLLTMSLILAGTLFTACNDDITLDPNGEYDNIDGVYGAVKNVLGVRELSTISIFGNGTGTGHLYFELTEKATQNVSVQLKIDQDALDKYNAANGTSYQIYPAAQVSMESNGAITIASGSQKSESIEIKVTSNGGVGNTYALPISAEVTAGGATVSKASQSYIYLIKPYNAIPDSDKGTGMKSILYIEVNDENILNAGEYTMVKSGKPFFDVVNIFAANINYSSETGRAYVNCNENISYVLKNADKFIRPLQAKGIKVVLTILGNHDEAGVSNLTPEAAADFARELKTYIDVYGLDGVDFDDEYSKYNTSNPSPGFEVPSRAAAARLVYECRKIMPDKIVSFYDYGNYVAGGTIEGQPVGDLLDYAYYGYYGSWVDRHESITGLGKTKYCPAPINLNFAEGNGGYNLSYAKRLRPEGYGIQMFYNLKPITYNYKQLFNDVSNAIFDDEVEWTGITYTKNSETGIKNLPSYSSYIGEWETVSANSLFYYYAGPWWDYSGSMTTTLTFEEKEAGKSYTVYGWYGTEGELPLTVNYNAETGRIEMPLPQTSIDSETGEEWLYMGRSSYHYTTNRWMNYDEQYTAYSGILNGGSIHFYAAPLPTYLATRTLSAIQLNAAGTEITAVKGYLDKEVVWQPYTMKQ